MGYSHRKSPFLHGGSARDSLYLLCPDYGGTKDVPQVRKVQARSEISVIVKDESVCRVKYMMYRGREGEFFFVTKRQLHRGGMKCNGEEIINISFERASERRLRPPAHGTAMPLFAPSKLT